MKKGCRTIPWRRRRTKSAPTKTTRKGEEIAQCKLLIADSLRIFGSAGAACGLHLSRRMNEFAEALKERTLVFALRVMKFCRTLPDNWEGRFIRDQLFRSSSRT